MFIIEVIAGGVLDCVTLKSVPNILPPSYVNGVDKILEMMWVQSIAPITLGNPMNELY